MGRANFKGEKGRPIVNCMKYRPCAAAMRPVVKFTLTTCSFIIINDELITVTLNVKNVAGSLYKVTCVRIHS